MKDVAQAETLTDMREVKQPPSTPAGDALLGRLLDDRYRILGLLGQGGMGLVYDAKHEILGTPLAIKVLRKDASGDEEAIERLKREAQAASAIGNEHIVDVRDFGRLPDGSVYVVMELLDGADLFRVVREGPMPVERVRHIALQICEALGAAHDRGIVHRDLKPENVLLITRRGDPDFVKVLDFGIAKVQNASLKLTAAGRVMGTPEYMSPEQCSGRAVDHRSDIYALGVMLYEMLAARLPFADSDLVELVRKQIHQPPLAPSVVRPDVHIPLELEAIVLRCLAKKPEDRPQTMQDVAHALLHLSMPKAPEPSPPPAEPVVAQARPTPPAHDRPSRGSWWVAATSVAVFAAAFGLYFGLGLGEPSIEPLAAPPRSVSAERPEPAAPAVPPAPVEVPTVPAPPSAPAPIAELVVRSDPPGAEVFRGETSLGTAPVHLARPSGQDRIEIRLVLRGHEPQSLMLSALSADDLVVSLDPLARPTVRPVAPASEPSRAEPPAHPTAGQAGPRREWRDPWEN